MGSNEQLIGNIWIPTSIMAVIRTRLPSQHQKQFPGLHLVCALGHVRRRRLSANCFFMAHTEAADTTQAHHCRKKVVLRHLFQCSYIPNQGFHIQTKLIVSKAWVNRTGNMSNIQRELRATRSRVESRRIVILQSYEKNRDALMLTAK